MLVKVGYAFDYLKWYILFLIYYSLLNYNMYLTFILKFENVPLKQ